MTCPVLEGCTTDVSLLIVGSARHPYLQFLGDIISSGLDSDKLDYLLRDATSAGLPLRYDLERYLHTVEVKKDFMVDPDRHLTNLYGLKRANVSPRRNSIGKPGILSYDTYQLRLPKRAASTLEQIIICKIMLYIYIYHHPKVRAAEGLLEKLLSRMISAWRTAGIGDEEILLKFLNFDDRWLAEISFMENSDVRDALYRLKYRVLPREVFRFSSAASHAEGRLIRKLFLNLKERGKRAEIVRDLEQTVGEELIKLDSNLGQSGLDALWNAGVWVDAPKPPQVEEAELSGDEYPAVSIDTVFPVEEWTEAYQAHRYYLRIYAYSEHVELAARAARKAMERKVGIVTDEFYKASRRKRN